jgi:PRTRC genetic system protein F
MNMSPLALPRIAADVPARYIAGDSRPFARNLALALMNGRLITEADAAALRDGASEHTVAETVFMREWYEITGDHRLFTWSLRVSEERQKPDSAWISIHNYDGAASCPIRYLRPGIMRLEQAAEGLGQTVLAVLFEACHHYLPSVCTPFETLGLAQYMYWYGEIDELGAMGELADMCDIEAPTEMTEARLDEFFRVCDTPRRRDFFRGAPRWVCAPDQVLNSEHVRHARKHARDLIFVDLVADACDELHRTITTGGPFARMDCRDASEHGIDYSMILLWDKDDGTGRVLDDFWNHELQGDYLDASTMTQLPLTGTSVRRWFDRMRNTSRVARATEDLLSLISSLDCEPAEPLAIRVRA